MTGTDLYKRTHKSVPVIFEPPYIIIVFFTNLMHKFFILTHLLHLSTCFEHCYAHPQEVKFVLVQHLVSLLSLGDCSVHRLRKDFLNLCTEQSPKESEETRCCTNTNLTS